MRLLEEIEISCMYITFRPKLHSRNWNTRRINLFKQYRLGKRDWISINSDISFWKYYFSSSSTTSTGALGILQVRFLKEVRGEKNEWMKSAKPSWRYHDEGHYVHVKITRGPFRSWIRCPPNHRTSCYLSNKKTDKIVSIDSRTFPVPYARKYTMLATLSTLQHQQHAETFQGPYA